MEMHQRELYKLYLITLKNFTKTVYKINQKKVGINKVISELSFKNKWYYKLSKRDKISNK